MVSGCAADLVSFRNFIGDSDLGSWRGPWPLVLVRFSIMF